MPGFRTSLRVAVAAAGVVAVVGAATASAGIQTTQPTNFAIFDVRLGPTGVAFKPTPTTTLDTTGEFRIYNASGKQRRFEIGGRETKLIRARKRTIFFLLFDTVGTVKWHSSGPKVKTFTGTFQVTPSQG